VGGAWVALASYVLARAARGALVLRVEDLDTARVVPGSQESILEDLAWLGLGWDEGPFAQGARAPIYEAAVARLPTYPCDCSRAEIARVASAPHTGEELVYPGTCRDRDPARSMKRAPATRLRVPEGATVRYDDGAAGTITQDVGREVGDFVLRRGDGTFAYQLAVVVDDLEMGITDVVRGADLVTSTPRQILLARLLGRAPPRYVHLPMVVGADGQRLAKRTRGARVAGLREAGIEARAVTGVLGHALGLSPDPAPRSPDQLAAIAPRSPRWPTEDFPIPW